MSLTIRRMRPGEEARLYEVLRAAVLRGTASRYDEAQRRAWAPDRPEASWAGRLHAGECFVAIVDGLIVGFMAVTDEGHVELAYVLPELHRAGIAAQLLDRVEREMRLTGVERMSTGASLIAEPFFARHGWQAERKEAVTRGGQSLPRVRMVKILAQETQAS